MKILSKIFPPPNYLNIPCFGVYISDTSVKYAQINSNSYSDKLVKFGRVELPEGIVKNGEILNSEKIIEILKNLKNKEKIDFVRLGIDESKVFQYVIEIPVEKIKNIKQIVEASVGEYSENSFKNFEVDYEIIDSNSKKLKVSVFVSKKSVINNYVSVFEKSKIKIVSIEPVGNAIVRALVDNNKNYLIVDIGKKKTDLHFVCSGKNIFSKEIFFGGDTITNSLVNKLNISVFEAENKKIKLGLSKSFENKDLFEILMPTMSSLKEKIDTIYIDWVSENKRSTFPDFKLQNIILSGGTAHMFGLKDYLATTLKIPVEIANPWINLRTKDSFVPAMLFEESLSFVQVVGLVMAEK